MRKDCAVFEESNVLASELNCAGLGAGGGHGVFSWTKEKKESNGEEIRYRGSSWSLLPMVEVDDTLDGTNRQGELRFGSGIRRFVRFQQPGEGEVEIGGTVGAAGIGVACQDNGLGHVTERGFWGLSANLKASTVVASPVPCSKTEEEMLLDGGGAIL